MSSPVKEFIREVEDSCDTPAEAMAELRAAQLEISEELGRLELLIIRGAFGAGSG